MMTPPLASRPGPPSRAIGRLNSFRCFLALMSYGPPDFLSIFAGWRVFSAALTRAVLFQRSITTKRPRHARAGPRHVRNFTFMIQLTAFAAGDKSFDATISWLGRGSASEIPRAGLRRDGVFGMKPARLAHDFVQQHCDDSAVKKSRAALVFIAKLKTSHDALARVILFEGQLHAARVWRRRSRSIRFRFGSISHRAVAQASACVLWISQGLTAHRPARLAGGLKSALLKPSERAHHSLETNLVRQRHARHFPRGGLRVALAHFRDVQHVGQSGIPRRFRAH